MSGGHLVIAPILIPFVAGAMMLLYDDRQRRAKLGFGLASTIALILVAIELLDNAKEATPGLSLYLLGDWAAPFGIVLVADRLAAIMLLLTSLVALPALVYSAAGWHRQGQHFHSLFQFLLMGLNGAFLTGDLFNLFVFFEVLLAASYGLLLHGSGAPRIRAGLHYIAMNLTGSLFFLVGVSLVYAVTGTLNMADLARVLPTLSEEARPLFQAGAAIMGTAFLVKAGVWPLSFWLSPAYMAASAPVSAMFSILTKVGVYIVLRLTMLLFGPDTGAMAGFGAGVLVAAGMATLAFGLTGVLASQALGRIAANMVLVSSGTVLAVNGFALAGGGVELLGGALYYMVGSTLAIAGLFLLLEPMSREEGGIAAMLALTADAYGLDPTDRGEPEVGLAIPATLTVLGLSFGACLLVLAGLPPLPGFIGKVAMLAPLLGPEAPAPAAAWTFLALLMLAGFATLVSLARVGIQTFWAVEGPPPRVLALEIAPVIGLIGIMLLLTVSAETSLDYARETALALHDPAAYAEMVLQEGER